MNCELSSNAVCARSAVFPIDFCVYAVFLLKFLYLFAVYILYSFDLFYAWYNHFSILTKLINNASVVE